MSSRDREQSASDRRAARAVQPEVVNVAKEIAPVIEESPGVATGPMGFDVVCARCSSRNAEIKGAEQPGLPGSRFWRIHYQCKTCGQTS